MTWSPFTLVAAAMSNRWLRTLAMLLGTAILATGCAVGPWETEENTPPPTEVPDSYLIVRGDTLYVIAWRYGLDYKDLAAWNHLKSPDRIYAGQRLRLTPPAPLPVTLPPPQLLGQSQPPPPLFNPPPAVTRTPPADNAVTPFKLPRRTAGQTAWRWPTDGKVVGGFQPDTPGGKGIEISGTLGQPVRAASTGQVVYSGSGLPGYGRLIIVKHSDTLLSAYGYLGRIFVKEGDSVKSGQSIAVLGTSSENRPVLHFEIRQHGKPVNPLDFLPG